MENLFLTVLNMSLKASYVIIFVIVIRLFLKRFPKVYSYALWFAVLFRLICPFSFDSLFSLIPKSVNIPQDIAYSPKPEINSGIAAIDSAVNNVLPPPLNAAASANPMQIWIAIGEAIWLIGIAVLIIYSVYATVKLYRNLRFAKHLEDNIYIINGYKTPFVFGIVNPKIYLPNHLTESEKSYVLLHEQTHIKRLDHIVKLAFFIVTCIHWFNPLVWAAFYLMGEDMELSCDEKVVKQMGNSIKKEYSSSLLSMSTGRRILGGSPIAFGENNTEGRIKNILNYKKPSLWVLIVVSIVIVIFIIGLITNPKSDEATTWDRRPMIMVNGELYLDTGKEVPVEIDESAIIGEISSSVDQSEKPTEEGQTNFGNIGAKYAHFEDNIVVLINNEWVLFEKEINRIKEEDKKRFYIMTADDGAPIGCEYGTTLEAGQIDTLEMLSMLEELQGFVFDEEYVSEQYIEFQFLDEEPKEINLQYIAKDGLQTEYPIDNETYRIKVPVNVGVHSFFADITWDNQEKETVFFDITIRAKEHKNYDKISTYLKEESINAFSQYYEILDFIISDYQEEVVDGNVEAIFSYNIIHKNYDRDPDTVQYIKEAKERGDKYYQTYYDEYLQPQNMNFYFKAVIIDENDNINLYTRNVAIESDEWHQVEMSDFVINKITEEHESEKINPNEPIENSIAEYISYNYEDRSIYIAGLKIFEEFGSEEFGFSNEGSARIINDDNAIEFHLTIGTGLVPGAGSITGPDVYFKMDIGTKKIVEKEFIPAPNYAEAAKFNPEYINPDSIQYSEKIIELSNERIVEIGEYLTEFIMEIESKLDYFTYED